MKKLPIIFLFLILASTPFYPQQERPDCPAWDIEGPDGTIKPRELVTFMANINKFGRLYKLEYHWTAFEGMDPEKGKDIPIFSGQGTTMITVVQPEKGVTVGLEIIGFPQDCLHIQFESALIASPPKAQAAGIGDCPKISVSGPAGIPSPGDTITFTAAVDTNRKDLKFDYLWSTEAGEIVSGQGTSVISVKVSGGTLAATVEIKGLPEGCPNKWSEHMIADPLPQAKLLETFRGRILPKDKTKFERFVLALHREESARGFIILSGETGKIRKNIKTIMGFMNRIYDVPRIVFVHGPPDIEVTETWLVPNGADEPNVDKIVERNSKKPQTK